MWDRPPRGSAELQQGRGDVRVKKTEQETYTTSYRLKVYGGALTAEQLISDLFDLWPAMESLEPVL